MNSGLHWDMIIGMTHPQRFTNYIMRFGSLILGISGIVMVAVDLLKTVAAMGEYISSVDDKVKKNADSSVPSKQEPTWKRIQMDDEM